MRFIAVVFLLALIALFLGPPPAAAQTTTLQSPTTDYKLAWSHPDISVVDHFETHWRVADPWVNVQIPTLQPDGSYQVPLPAFADGSYVAEVRACNTGGCSAPLTLPFIVETPPPPAPAPPTNLRIVRDPAP